MYVLEEAIKDNLQLINNTHVLFCFSFSIVLFWSNITAKTLLRPQQIVNDPFLKVAVDGVLELIYFFLSSHPVPLECGAGPFPYENSLSYFARY